MTQTELREPGRIREMIAALQARDSRQQESATQGTPPMATQVEVAARQRKYIAEGVDRITAGRRAAADFGQQVEIVESETLGEMEARLAAYGGDSTVGRYQKRGEPPVLSDEQVVARLVESGSYTETSARAFVRSRPLSELGPATGGHKAGGIVGPAPAVQQANAAQMVVYDGTIPTKVFMVSCPKCAGRAPVQVKALGVQTLPCGDRVDVVADVDVLPPAGMAANESARLRDAFQRLGLSEAGARVAAAGR